MKKSLWLILGLIAILLIGSLFLKNSPSSQAPQDDATSAQGLKLGEAKVVDGASVTALDILDDSRCAEGMQCVWAGTVVVKTFIKMGSTERTENLELNKPFSLDGKEIILTSVFPYPKEDDPIHRNEYRFEFSIKEKSSAAGGCYVGGCSSQICSDQPDIVTTCEYKEEYACYKTAKCERQPSGQCGWTLTSELNMCLSSTQ